MLIYTPHLEKTFCDIYHCILIKLVTEKELVSQEPYYLPSLISTDHGVNELTTVYVILSCYGEPATVAPGGPNGDAHCE